MSHLSASGAGLRGRLGVDVLQDPLLLGDGMPVSNLVSLDLSNNSISGFLPNGSVLTPYHVNGTGPGPFTGIDFPCLFWNLSRNQLAGGLPPRFYLHSALVVDLSYNGLSGPLPDNWTLLETAVVLDLSGEAGSAGQEAEAGRAEAGGGERGQVGGCREAGSKGEEEEKHRGS